MKSKNITRSLLAATACVILMAGGCRKDKEFDSETGTAVDNAFAEAVFNDAATMSDEAYENGSVSSFRGGNDEASLLSNCATVTVDTVSTPRMITIDFGPVNCLCADGRYRRGAIIITYTGHYRDAGSAHTIGFNNYYVSDYHIQGTKTVTNEGVNSAGHTWFSVVVDGSVTSPGGQVFTRQATRQREWIAGENTQIRFDDVYLVTGSATGNTFSGNSYTAQITTPLEIALNCRWIKNGVVEFTPAGKLTRHIDFGYLNGNCDRYAQVTIGSHTFVVELR